MNIYQTAVDVDPIASQVGPNKDSYSIHTYFTLCTESNNVLAETKAVKNWYSNTKEEELFHGTYKECYDHIQSII